MKKIIAILLVLCALAALTVSAFAAEAPKTEPAVTTDPAPAEKMEITAKLTEADALAAALKDAGEKEADVTVTKNKLSEKATESGETIPVYTVKFTTDTTTYKYYLDGNTGAVIYKSVEFQNPDVVLKSHSRTEASDRGDKASGEMNANGDAATGTTSGSSHAGRSGGRKSVDAQTGASADLTDTTGV